MKQIYAGKAIAEEIPNSKYETIELAIHLSFLGLCTLQFALALHGIVHHIISLKNGGSYELESKPLAW
jgi:hypothetical protein